MIAKIDVVASAKAWGQHVNPLRVPIGNGYRLDGATLSKRAFTYNGMGGIVCLLISGSVQDWKMVKKIDGGTSTLRANRPPIYLLTILGSESGDRNRRRLVSDRRQRLESPLGFLSAEGQYFCQGLNVISCVDDVGDFMANLG